VEHIIPRSRYPDDSFQNKTLCYLPENREHKRNQTPFEAYSNNPDVWAQILLRVTKWSNPGKLSRFKIQSESELADFSARHMNDTRYTSVLAGRLLAMLYGGRDVESDNGNRQVIFASSGAVTATLRRSWGFERILQAIVSPEPGETRGKPRTDHRHHAVDAITIALTRQSVIQAMANASAFEPWQPGTRSWRRVPEPWTTPDFIRSLTGQIEKMGARFDNRTTMIALLETLRLISPQEARELEQFDFLDSCPLYSAEIDEDTLAAHGFHSAGEGK
jgi:CRISPR-associated endonuclease Csn1